MKELPDSTRLETFSDGVFAIAVTLLIFQVKVPDRDDVSAAGGLWRALGTRWPSYLGYVISFLTLGIMWVNHHAIFQYVRRVDRRFLLVNILFLMGIAFLPFPTAVLAEYLPEQEQRVAATMFWWSTRHHRRALQPRVVGRHIPAPAARHRGQRGGAR